MALLLKSIISKPKKIYLAVPKTKIFCCIFKEDQMAVQRTFKGESRKFLRGGIIIKKPENFGLCLSLKLKLGLLKTDGGEGQNFSKKS